MEQKTNRDSLVEVTFYLNGIESKRDFIAPFSHTFDDLSQGVHTLTAIGKNRFEQENILERRIYVEDMSEGTSVPYGTLSLLPLRKELFHQNLGGDDPKPILVGTGSTLVAVAEFDDLDGRVENVEFFVNGKKENQTFDNQDGPHFISFQPFSSSGGFVEVNVVATDNDGNTVVKEDSILVYDPVPFPQLSIEGIDIEGDGFLAGEKIKINVVATGVSRSQLQSIPRYDDLFRKLY